MNTSSDASCLALSKVGDRRKSRVGQHAQFVRTPFVGALSFSLFLDGVPSAVWNE